MYFPLGERKGKQPLKAEHWGIVSNIDSAFLGLNQPIFGDEGEVTRERHREKRGEKS